MPLLLTPDVAKLAKVSEDTVLREIKRGNLAAERIGRQWIISETDAREWADTFTPYRALRKDES